MRVTEVPFNHKNSLQMFIRFAMVSMLAWTPKYVFRISGGSEHVFTSNSDLLKYVK